MFFRTESREGNYSKKDEEKHMNDPSVSPSFLLMNEYSYIYKRRECVQCNARVANSTHLV